MNMITNTIDRIDSLVDDYQSVSESSDSFSSELSQALSETKEFLINYNNNRSQQKSLRLIKEPTLVQKLMTLELITKSQLVVAAGTGTGKTFGSLESMIIAGAKRIWLTCPPNLSLQWLEKIHDDFDAHVILMSSDAIQDIDPNIHGSILKVHGIWTDSKEVMDASMNPITNIKSLEDLTDNSVPTIIITPNSYISLAKGDEVKTLQMICDWSDGSIRDESHEISSSAKSERVDDDSVDDDGYEDEAVASKRHKLMRELTGKKVNSNPDYLVMSLTATPCPTGQIQKIVNLISMTTGREPLRTGFSSQFQNQSSSDLTWAASYVHRNCFVVPSHDQLPTGFDPELQSQFRLSETWHEDYDGLHMLNLTSKEINELAGANLPAGGCGYHSITTKDKVNWVEENLISDSKENWLLYFNWVDAEGKGAQQREVNKIEDFFQSELDEGLVISMIGRNLQETLDNVECPHTSMESFFTSTTIEPNFVETTVPPAQTGPKSSSEIIGCAFSHLRNLGYDVKSYRLGNLVGDDGERVESLNSMKEVREWVQQGSQKILLCSNKISTGTDGLQNLFRKLALLNLPPNPSILEQLVGRILRNRIQPECEFWGEPVEIHYILKAAVENVNTGEPMYDQDLKAFERLIKKERVITQIVEGIDPNDHSKSNLDDITARFTRKYSSDEAIIGSLTSLGGHADIITA